jgi:hypothetical protein
MRSRAFTAGWPGRACVLKYACQVRFPAPAAVASVWQCASAPANPPRLPPSPMVWLVTKKFIIGDGFAPRGYSPGLGLCASNRQDASKSVQDNINTEDLILVIVRSKCERRVTQEASRGQPLSVCFIVTRHIPESPKFPVSGNALSKDLASKPNQKTPTVYLCRVRVG